MTSLCVKGLLKRHQLLFHAQLLPFYLLPAPLPPRTHSDKIISFMIVVTLKKKKKKKEEEEEAEEEKKKK